MQVIVRKFLLERDHEYSIHLCFALKDWPSVTPSSILAPKVVSHARRVIAAPKFLLYSVISKVICEVTKQRSRC